MKTGNRLQTMLILLLLLVSPPGGTHARAEESPSGVGAIGRLRLDLDRIFTDGRFAGSRWGIEVYSLDREEYLYEKNPTQLLLPASNTKIVTAAVALMRLGPDYRFRTLLLTDGQITDGALKGNLIVVGYGDPSITVKNPDEDPFETFRAWADKLKEKGVHKISGDILGDGSAFEPTMLGQGWSWDDLTEGYAAPISALQFNGNRLWLQISPGKKNDARPLVTLQPLPFYWHVENELAAQPNVDKIKLEIDRNSADESILVRGAVPESRSNIVKEVAISDPVHWYLSALKHVLETEHIEVSTSNLREIRGTDPRPLTLLEKNLSPPLSEILKSMLKDSRNLYAETLIRVLGMEMNGNGSFTGGKEVVEEALGQMAIDADTYSYADGSGLSRLNLLSAEELVRILRSMYRNPNFSCFYNALAVAGIDGTLENRLKRPPVANNLRGKTGSLTGVSAISGYMKTADDEMLAFSLIANNFLTPKSDVDAAQDRALKKLAEFSRKETTGNR